VGKLLRSSGKREMEKRRERERRERERERYVVVYTCQIKISSWTNSV